MTNADKECLRHYTQGEYRCQSCGYQISAPYNYQLHHMLDNGQEHAQLIVKQNPELKKALFGGDDNDNTRSRLGQTIRTWLVKNKFKTDEEFPIQILCADCHKFVHKEGRVLSTKEIIIYHKSHLSRHYDAMVHMLCLDGHQTHF